MVFPSVPVYLDPPNWNQQQAQQPRNHGGGGGGGGGGATELTQLPPLPPPRVAEGSGMPSSSATRPNSMSERARLAKIPQPEPALKCPRCDSTNTKFCYYNNYSLSQPRHFCKTCRRYWTRGGALRNVPVGGGCRRNKRTKSGSSSKSSKPGGGASSSSSSSSSALAFTAMSSGLGGAIPPSISAMPHHLPFMGSMHHLTDVGAPNIGLSFSGIPPLGVQHVGGVEFPVGSGGAATTGLDQWRVQQFPFLGGLELPPPPLPPSSVPPIYHLDLESAGANTAAFALGQHTAKAASSSVLTAQLESVKMEDNPQGMSLQRQYLGMRQGDNIWGGGSSIGGSGDGGGSGGGGGWLTDLGGNLL